MDENRITGVTESGFAFSFDKRVLSDWRFMELLGILSDENVTEMDKVNGYTRLVTMLLGAEQKKALLEHVSKENDGFAPMDKVEKVLNEIMFASAAHEIKN